MHRRVNVNHTWLSPRLLLSVCGLLLVLLLAGCDLMGASGTPTPVVTATPAGPTDTPVPPTATPVPPTNTPSPRTLAGHVLDAYSGRPISGARVTAGTSASGSAADGGYDLGVVAPGTMVEAAAPGYAPATVDSSAGATLDISLRPTTLHGRVTDSKTGKPLQGVIVRIDLAGAPAAPAVTATTTVTSSGALAPLLGRAPLSFQVDITPTATSEVAPTGAVTDTAPTAVPSPTVPPSPPPVMPTPYADDKMILAVTDADGNYSMDNVPENPLVTFKMPGYKLTKVTVGRTATQDQALDPFVVKAVYMTASAATYDPLYQPIIEAADKTEINAIVLNIQDDNARLVYDTQVKMAVDSGAISKILPNIKNVVAEFHKHNLYVIARMVTFMQPAVAEANPSLSVLSKATGKPWKGGELSQQRWLDPTNPAARQYPLALAREAVSLGFDEIQFDYIRFPSDPAPGEHWDNMTFSQPVDSQSKPKYIEQFATEAHNMLNTTDAFMSVDIFGYTVWPDQNGQALNAVIGQVFPNLIGHTDYICPMIYPSHFSRGEMGFSDPNAHPYEIIKQAGIYTGERMVGQRAKYRPWLQGFDWTHLVYDAHLYRLQIQAADETGAAGWMFWDPSNVYSVGGFLPEP
jgi:hypothetical protein